MKLRPHPHISIVVWTRNFFVADRASGIPHINNENGIENAPFRKRSAKWNFLKMQFVLRIGNVWTTNPQLFENNDIMETECIAGSC